MAERSHQDLGKAVTAARLGSGVCPGCGTGIRPGVSYCGLCGCKLSGSDTLSVGDVEPSVREPGSVVGSYRLLQLLGEGGMGQVYLAEHTRLGRKVAVKLLRPELSGNREAVRRFFDEARAVNRIAHENIVEITDFVQEPGGDNYYIMELLTGETLAALIARERTPPLARTLAIGIQVAGALAAVHAAGIVHRDLKPDNLFLVSRSGRKDFVKILDFGVAKLMESPQGAAVPVARTAGGAILGTPEYMSPEQASGKPVDFRSDIYSLGVILYELVAGAKPFEADSFGELVVKHLTIAPAELGSIPGLRFPVPDELEKLIMRCLAKDRSRRPQSMADVEAPLRAIAEGRPNPDPAAPLAPLDARPSGEHAAVSDRFTGPVPVVVAGASTATGAGRSASGLDLAVAGAPAPAARSRSRRRITLAVVGGAGIALVAAWAVRSVTGGDDRPPAAPAPLAASAPAPGDRVEVVFESTPSGAEIFRDGESTPLGVTPFTGQLPRSAEPVAFWFRRPGHEPVRERIALDRAARLAVTLPPVAAVPPPPAAPVAGARPAGKRGAAKVRRPARPTGPGRPDKGGVIDAFED